MDNVVQFPLRNERMLSRFFAQPHYEDEPQWRELATRAQEDAEYYAKLLAATRRELADERRKSHRTRRRSFKQIFRQLID